MKFYPIIILLGLNVLQPAFAGCWSAQENASLQMTELDGELTFSIKDAITCQPVTNAIMTMGETTLTSDAAGKIKIQSPEGIMDALIPVTIKRDGYMPLNDTLRIEMDVAKNTRFLISKVISVDKVRFVLSWSHEPVDLDLHLTAKDFHVSYRDMNNYQNRVTLDTDAQEGYGAETITVSKMNPSDTYRLFVHKYSNEHSAFLDQQAKVSVYYDGRLDRIVSLPKTRSKTVEVLHLKNGAIQYINQPVDKI